MINSHLLVDSAIQSGFVSQIPSIYIFDLIQADDGSYVAACSSQDFLTGYIYHSPDLVNWSLKLTTYISQTQFALRIKLLKDSSGNIFCFGGGATFHTSTNHGLNWSSNTALAGVLTEPVQLRNAMFAADGSLLVVGQHHPLQQAKGFLARSTNGGTSFSLTANNISTMCECFGTKSNGDILVGIGDANADVYSSNNSGASLSYLSRIASANKRVVVLYRFQNTSIILAAVDGGGIYRSTNDATSFVNVLVKTDSACRIVAVNSVVYFSFANESKLYVSYDNGVTIHQLIDVGFVIYKVFSINNTLLACDFAGKIYKIGV